MKANTSKQPVNMELSYDLHPPVWITDTALRRSPFVPQMGDEVGISIKILEMLVLSNNIVTEYRKTLFGCLVLFCFLGNIFPTRP